MIGKHARIEVFWVGAGQGLTLVLGIATLKLLTSLLGAEEYGRFALALSLAGALNLFFYGPLSQAVSRYFHVCTESGVTGLAALDAVVSRALRQVGWMVLAVGLALVSGLWLLAWMDWALLAAAALAYGVASGVLSVYLADFNTRRQRRLYALLQSADAAVRLVMAVALAFFWAKGALWSLLGFVAGSLLVVVVAHRFSRRKNPCAASAVSPADVASISISFMRYAASFSLLALPALFAAYGDRWLIQRMMSDADVGVYVALTQIAGAPANLLLSVFSQTLNPVLFQRAGAADQTASIHASRRLLYRALVLLAAALVLIVAVSLVFGASIVRWMTSDAFAVQGHLLWQLVLAAAVFQLGQALAAEAFVYNRPSLLFFPKMAHAAVLLGFACLLIPVRGLEGVVWAAEVAALAYLALVMAANVWAGRRYLPNQTLAAATLGGH